jgi:serine protease Do
MRYAWSRTAITLFVLGVVVASGAGTEATAQYSRRTPVVEAVQKTKDAIVTVKVDKKGVSGRKETVGTGVIVDERGYVVTNRHVVASAEQVKVYLADGPELTAEVLVEDANHDLAVLKIKHDKKLQALSFGPSSDLMVGETVIAVGHPFGYKNTVSTGIVSALDREINMPGGETLTGLVQTCASINPGNSGGPLLNINGELIGINVALREGAQGIAFALPSDTVQRVLSKHLSAAKLSRVNHGLVCKEDVKEEGDYRQRVIVSEVAGETPAAQAGLKCGDAILCVADRMVANRLDVERALWGCKPGAKVDLTILRQGKEKVVTLVLDAKSDGGKKKASDKQMTASDETRKLR